MKGERSESLVLLSSVFDGPSADQIREVVGAKPRVCVIDPKTVEGVLDGVLAVASAIGRESAGVVVATEIRNRLFELGEFVNCFEDGPSVAAVRMGETLVLLGDHVPQMVERAGGRSPLNPTHPTPLSGAAAGPQQGGRIAGENRKVSVQELVEAELDWLIVESEGAINELVHEMKRVGRGGRVPRRVVVAARGALAATPVIEESFRWMVSEFAGRREVLGGGGGVERFAVVDIHGM